MAVGNAGTEDERIDAGAGPIGRIVYGDAVLHRGVARGRVVVPGGNALACRQQGMGGDAAGPAEPEDGKTMFGKGGEIDHPAYRSFRVERPISARTEAMIQKRMTIVGSAQPSFSK